MEKEPIGGVSEQSFAAISPIYHFRFQHDKGELALIHAGFQEFVRIDRCGP